MIRIFFYFLIAAIGLTSSVVLASNLVLKIEFSSSPNDPIYTHPIHTNKIIKMDPGQDFNSIILTQSKIENNFPVTLAMLVRPVDINNQHVSLKFNLVQYSFIKHTHILAQPGLTLQNGQTVEMKNAFFTLKVKAQWDV